MPHVPVADVDVTLELVHRLLLAQHPDLAGEELEILTSGWDNVLVRVGMQHLARLPRRALGAPLVEHEQRWLPELASRLPLPVPVPVRVGLPEDGYPWRWSIVRFHEGSPASETPPDPGPTVADLPGFLAALHCPAPPEAPVNPFRGAPLAGRAEAFASNLGALEGLGAERLGAPLRSVLDAALTAPAWAGPPLWLHGDLHPANLLVRHGRLAAVIDFGDITSGDPATDLASVWFLVPQALHDEFWASYRAQAGYQVDEAVVTRASGWAAHLGLMLLVHHDAGHPLHRAGRTAVERLVEERC